MREPDLHGKRIVVVGGSMGIGLAAAARFVAGGAHVTVLARRPGPLADARAALERARCDPGQEIASAVLDAGDPAATTAVLGGIVAERGAPDVLFNCAGRAYPRRFEDVDHAQLADTFRANLATCWNTIQVVVPAMKARGSGAIVNTASLAGLIGIFGYTDYCASKFAVVGFSEALRSELKPHGVTVAVLCPPDTDTPGFAVENTTKPPETAAASAGAAMLGADDVAAALLDGMARGSWLIIPGRDGRMLALMKRFVPGVVERLTDRAIARARRG